MNAAELEMRIHRTSMRGLFVGALAWFVGSFMAEVFLGPFIVLFARPVGVIIPIVRSLSLAVAVVIAQQLVLQRLGNPARTYFMGEMVGILLTATLPAIVIVVTWARWLYTISQYSFEFVLTVPRPPMWFSASVVACLAVQTLIIGPSLGWWRWRKSHAPTSAATLARTTA